MSISDEEKKNFDELKEYIDSMKNEDGPLMPIMQKAQNLFGALTIEVQQFISDELGIPMTDVYGVATFYSQFNLVPKGKYLVGVCMGTACYVKNTENILNKVSEVLGIKPGETSEDKLFSLDATRCLGCCGLAPVIMINDQVFGRLQPDDIPGIIDKFRA